MNDILKAFCILEREHLITNLEKAARSLGIWNLVSQNTQAELWVIAHAPEAQEPGKATMNGSVPVTVIETEKNPDFDPTTPPPSPARKKAKQG